MSFLKTVPRIEALGGDDGGVGTGFADGLGGVFRGGDGFGSDLSPWLPRAADAVGAEGAGVADGGRVLNRPELAEELGRLAADVDRLRALVSPEGEPLGRLDLFHSYMGVFVVAFLVTLLVTPFMRMLAIRHGIIDKPDLVRKHHRVPVAYLGGAAVYVGLMCAILFSYTSDLHGLMTVHETSHTDKSLLPRGVPLSVVLGMTVIMFIGLWGDVVGIDPRAKIAGMLFASAALRWMTLVCRSRRVSRCLLRKRWYPLTTLPSGLKTVMLSMPVPGGYGPIDIDLVYWIGTGVIAVFVLGACNASNLIDGLDGLLSGVTGIAALGLLVVALGLAIADDGPRDASRIVLCLALLGACLGFLPHNFNPATIFLGDCGSLLLGFTTIVIVLSLGDTGKTHLVLAGLIIYAIPIIDTKLAIVRRKVSGKRISDADDQHLHHMLKRALGVRGAVLTLYGLGISFGVLGIALSESRARLIYAIALVFAAFIGVTSFKIARRAQWERQAAERLKGEAASAEDGVRRSGGGGVGGGLNGGRGGGAVAAPSYPPTAPASARGEA